MSQICIIFEKPNENNYNDFLNETQYLKHVEFDNNDPEYQSVSYIEIDTEDSSPQKICLKLLSILEKSNSQFCSIIAQVSSNNELTGPATYDAFFDGKRERFHLNADKVDFDIESLTAAGMDQSMAEAIQRRFFPVSFNETPPTFQR